MERGLVMKVSKDFFTTIDGELSLAKGDHFLIYDVIDKHWYYGESRDRRGKFPSNHLHKVDIPDIQETDELFISIATFRGEQSGDLSFGEGELVVGTRQVETNWYTGHVGSREGIFPLSHVWRLDRSILKKPLRKKSVRKRARVKTSLRAQLNEELDLREGEIVNILEILEDGWVRGTNENGKEGTFPEAFVAYMEEEKIDATKESSDSTVDSSYRVSMDADPLPNSILKCETIHKDFGQANSTNYNNEPAPNYYDLFPEASFSGSNSQFPKSYSQPSIEITEIHSDDNLNPLGVEPYAITLYPFNAQFPNELSFAEGEIVHLVKHLDAEWAEGTIDDSRGFFPISYVNVIVDCAEANDENAVRALPEVETRSQIRLEAGASVKVDYTFEAQMDGDLSVTEGDTVVIVEMANDDWVSVKNSLGSIGLCPRAYLNAEIHVDDSDARTELLEDIVVMRRNDMSEVGMEMTEEREPKRLSVPHRPAPPAPAPGRMPLSKQSISDKIETRETMPESGERSCAMSPDLAEKKKRADKRQNVISELVITEKEYVRDLKVTYETFNLYNPCILESRGIDVGVLFGNILEVIQVAEELLELVLRSMKGFDENCQTVAPCFLTMADKLQTAYVKYCGNHEAALILLKKYEDNRDIMNIFEKGIETLRRQVVCFDMSSILIKPVQRILKYPLMLCELIKCTEEDHPDRKGIEEARKAMTEVASYINEYKRRKDLVSKYLDEDNTLMRRMSKLTMHSVAKKSSRLSAKLSASLGLTNLSADPEFEELERQFKLLEKCTWQLSKDVEQCIAFINDEAMYGEVLSVLLTQYYAGKSDNEIKRYGETRATIRSNYVQNLRIGIEQRVNVPINSLIILLEGPAVLINKRYDKLLDYDNAISRSDKSKESKIAQDELIVAKTNFEALNQQLLDELPILIDAATSILVKCIGAFAKARKYLNGRIMQCYLTLSASATQISPQNILESFLVNHNLIWNQINRNTFAGANPGFSVSSMDLCPQNERQRTSLRKKYSPDRLYVTMENIDGTSSLDLSAVKGTLVAVIKNQDPMGDSSRWYVDNGVAQGFVPRRGLQRVSSALPETSNSSIDVADSVTIIPDLMSLDSPEKTVPQHSCVDSQINPRVVNSKSESIARTNFDAFNQPQRYENVQPEFFHAAYDYEKTADNTLAIKKGQTLRLVRRENTNKNEGWWFMQDRSGNIGYVPSNYLKPAISLPPDEVS